MSMVSKYLRLLLAFFRYSLTREMMFKTNFILWIVVDFLWFGAQIVFIQVLFYQTPAVAGWSKYQMIMLFGTNHLIQQLFSCFFMTNCTQIPELIRTGKLDFQLVLPVNTQFLVSTRNFDPGALINSSIGLAFVIYAAINLGIHPTVLQYAMYVVFMISGIFLHYALLMLIVTLSFWIIRAQGLVYGYYNLFQIARIPSQAFKGIVWYLFTFALPMLVVANFPARVMAFPFSASELWMLWTLGLTVLFVWMAGRFWNYALRHYTSASS